MSSNPQIPDDVAALISAHALGALDPGQAELAEQHIAASDACRHAYEDALETAAALALAVADSEPRPELRTRILAAARAEGAPATPPAPARRRGWHLPGWLTPSGGFAIAGAVAAIVFAVVAVSEHRDAADVRDHQAALVSILSAPGARVVPLATSGGGAQTLRVVVAPGRAALISGLPPAPAGHTYQAWGLSAGGAAAPLPTFSGDGAVVIPGGLAKYAKVAVTVEPSGGSQQPTTTPIAVATL